MLPLDADELWTFSLRFYGNDAVCASCLALQDDCGADVNVLMLAFFAATRGAQFASPFSADPSEPSNAWRESLVVPIRRVRRSLKNTSFTANVANVGQFKKSLQAVELEAERIQQRLLIETGRFTAADLPPSELARLNIEVYARGLDQGLDETHVARLHQIFTNDYSHRPPPAMGAPD
ncbi:MAG: TIGR02444 family protein [Methylovirgula sp.]|uniref:TIGR02444 family protein n=1 Tax=Methylovirgula sp. TaxID=1978224 RepID=UPI0030764059